AQATRKGFTDHEHLDEVELIHMNGRVYDYNLGRFLSVDPFIQGVGNSQGINPYSYVMNNPLGYTDPTGYSAVETEEVKKVSTGSRIAKRTGETKQTATVTSNGVSTTVTKTTKSNGSSSYTSTSNGGGRSKTLTGDIGSQQQIAKNDSTNENPNGTFYFGGAGLNGDYISGMKDALEEAGISGVTTIGPEGLSGGAIVDAAIGYLALNEKMEGFPHSLGLPDSGSEQFNMIGYSFGSLLAAQYSAKYADAGFKVDNLVLVGSPISKKFLTELQGHKNIRNIKVKDLTSHGDPIRAGMSVGNPIKAYNLITTLGSQDEQRNGSGHFYYRCTNCGATGQQRRKQLAQELYDGGLR
uniref:alpha/beta fold hydrolase n=1 Tax=Alteromonas lipotrueiana TaxID=2803815 RepID=UPI001C475E7C